jgi:predicted adenylyl cyclase CyaB
MASNVEIKAQLPERDAVEAIAARLEDGGVEHLDQTDVYFRVPTGRLKLRIFAATLPRGVAPEAELIQYHRTDARDPEVSTYQRVPVADHSRLRSALAAALGERVVVHKRRTVYLVGRTRIHIDRVEGLGDFLELEVVLRENEDQSIGDAEARTLMQTLGVRSIHLIEASYADLLEASASGTCTTLT